MDDNHNLVIKRRYSRVPVDSMPVSTRPSNIISAFSKPVVLKKTVEYKKVSCTRLIEPSVPSCPKRETSAKCAVSGDSPVRTVKRLKKENESGHATFVQLGAMFLLVIRVYKTAINKIPTRHEKYKPSLTMSPSFREKSRTVSISFELDKRNVKSVLIAFYARHKKIINSILYPIALLPLRMAVKVSNVVLILTCCVDLLMLSNGVEAVPVMNPLLSTERQNWAPDSLSSPSSTSSPDRFNANKLSPISMRFRRTILSVGEWPAEQVRRPCPICGRKPTG